MAQARRRRPRRRKKRRPIRKFLMFVALVAIIAATLYCIISNMGKARNKLEEAAYPIKYSACVDSAADKYQLDRPYIYAIIRTESRFDPESESHVGAKGLMQLMPATFDWLAAMRDEAVSADSYTDPETNIDYGCYLLRYLLDRYDGDENVAAAAYNAGLNKVDEWLKDPDVSPDGKNLENIPYGETAKYVKKVSHAKEMYKKLYF